ncbi:MAG TPA: glycosyltransferase [Longimicrobiales bacterium]|jgi:mannosyltransferase OCH1-like enzyme
MRAVIPRILHQTHSTREAYVALRRRLPDLWRVRHPGWEYRFHDDVACRDLVVAERPDLLALYDGFPLQVQRTDLWRMLALRTHGGFYADLDVVFRRPLDDLCDLECVVAEEKTLDAEALARHGHEHALRVANYMLGAAAGHPFLDALLDAMVAACRPIRSEEDVLESTGPGLVTRVYHQAWREGRGVTLLPNPGVRCRNPSCGSSCQFGDYATHLHLGSWRW